MVPGRDRAVNGLSALGRRYPLYRGHGWLAHHVLPAPAPATGGRADPREVALRRGPRVLVRTDEFIGRIVFYFGELDPRISWVCRRLLRPGDVVVDVGANYGVVALLAAQLVGPTGTVHAVEPQPEVASLLRRSAIRNGFLHLHVHELALSDSDGELELSIPVGHLGGASLSRTADQASAVAVQVRHSGRFLFDLDVADIRLLKLDIEGHEPEFLRGGRAFLGDRPPAAILFESNDGLYASSPPVGFWEREPVRALRELDYEMVRIGQAPGAVAPRLSRVAAGRDDPGLDFVAIHRPRYREVAGLLGVR